MCRNHDARYEINVPKGIIVVRVKLLLRHPNTTNQYFLAPNTEMTNVPITALIDPSSLQTNDSLVDRKTSIKYETTETLQTKANKKTCTQKDLHLHD
jgi:hypothetical protein